MGTRRLLTEPGPSPRTRGKPVADVPELMRARSIPANAGKLCGQPQARQRRRSIPANAGEARLLRWRHRGAEVHPRERGGSIIWTPEPLSQPGPSPRTRGKLSNRCSPRCHSGSIPANAGEAALCDLLRLREKVHPRERGGSTCCRHAGARYVGPSPRTRGKRFAVDHKPFVKRSIPANAGSSGQSPYLERKGGPSPRTRGKLIGRAARGLARRSIPANAGEATGPSGRACGTRVHPRERGGSVAGELHGGCQGGPSPRTRGKRLPVEHHRHSHRSIPANAGEALVAWLIVEASWVHPRERGGSQSPQLAPVLSGGPSPRTRGKRRRHAAETLLERSIPANAGEAAARLMR